MIISALASCAPIPRAIIPLTVAARVQTSLSSGHPTKASSTTLVMKSSFLDLSLTQMFPAFSGLNIHQP
jgi:hypothetical protein